MSAYKRVLALGLSLLMLLSLAACTVQPGEDYGEFVPPEETDTLVLYENPLLSDIIDRALMLFRRKYPDVNVEYRRYSLAQYDEMTTTLNAELAAGEGPDIFWDYYFNYDFSKVKSMENGIYVDLEPFFEWDDEINLADYNEAALNAGMYMGHRYMVPLYFETMVWVTTQEVLDQAGLDIGGGRQDFVSFMDMMRAYKAENPDVPILGQAQKGLILKLFLPYSGMKTVSVEDRQITLDTAQFRTLVDVYKDLFYEHDWLDRETLDPLYGINLTKRETLFYYQYERRMRDFAEMYAILKSTQTPVLVNCPSFDGRVIGQPDLMAFIREGSPNQLNAWRFLKILLSEEIQADTRIFGVTLPVLRSAMKTRLTDAFSEYRKPGSMKTDDYGILTWAEVTEEEIDEIISVIYEIDDCWIDPANWYVSGDMFSYIAGESGYESCYDAFVGKLMLMLNE